jgi:hypothetical protein
MEPDLTCHDSPPLPASQFRATVHGLAFADRSRHLSNLAGGDRLLLLPDPPGAHPEQVWVHLREGDPLGHLPDEIGGWLAPWMRGGGPAHARVVRVGDGSVPSWKRLLVEVVCGSARDEPGAGAI